MPEFERVGNILPKVKASQGRATSKITASRAKAKAEPKPRCARCRDTYALAYDVPLTDPRFGKSYSCPCYWEMRLREPPWAGHGLPDFKPEPGTAEALKQTWRWAKGQIKFLVVSGVTGSGKTHLSRGAIMHILTTDGRANWRDVTETMEWLKEGFHASDTPAFEARLETLMAPIPTVLDDIGAEQGTAWSRATLTRIINGRKNMNYPTMFTTNHLPKTLAEWTDARIASRVFDRQDGVVVVMKGTKDYRMKEKL